LVEGEIESKDEEAKRSMRALEQTYNSMKVWRPPTHRLSAGFPFFVTSLIS